MDAKSNRGFTLVELIVAMVLAILLLVTAVPSMQEMLARHRLLTLHQELRGALYLARSHALAERVATSVCPRSESGGCASGRGDWSRGWIVFEDGDHGGSCRPAGGYCQGSTRRVLRVYPSAPSAFPIRANTNVSRRVRYSPLGMSPGSNGRFTLCDRGGAVQPLGLVVASTGRVRGARQGDLLACP